MYKALLLVLLFTVACKTAEKFDARMNRLALGMSPEAVSAIVGPPELREAKTGSERWLYGLSGPVSEQRYILFTDGKVAEFGRNMGPAPTTTPGNSDQINPISAAPSIPKEIGQACKEDDDCESKRCHLKVCAGKNNCSVLVGKPCANNTQCCSGLCDFGFCRQK